MTVSPQEYLLKYITFNLFLIKLIMYLLHFKYVQWVFSLSQNICHSSWPLTHATHWQMDRNAAPPQTPKGKERERERERNKPIPECLGRCGLSWILSEFTWACHLHTGSLYPGWCHSLLLKFQQEGHKKRNKKGSGVMGLVLSPTQRWVDFSFLSLRSLTKNNAKCLNKHWF